MVHVPTESITHYCLFKHPKRRFVLEGDWDLNKKDLFSGLLNHPHFSCVYELAEGRAYWETQHFAKMMKALQKSGRTERGIANEEGVHDYFRKLVQIYTDVRDHGYKSQRELGKSGSVIHVSIDRKGALLKYYEGHHRLAIAKVLGIEYIPVCVQFVHRQWFDQWCDRFKGNVAIVVEQGLQFLETVRSSCAMRRLASAPAKLTDQTKRVLFTCFQKLSIYLQRARDVTIARIALDDPLAGRGRHLPVERGVAKDLFDRRGQRGDIASLDQKSINTVAHADGEV